MPTYRIRPVDLEAVQFTGDNWAEMHEFTGHFQKDDNGRPGPVTDVFTPFGEKPVLWVQAKQAWLNIEEGEWVAKDELGFYPIKDSVFQKSYTEVAEPDVESLPSGTDEPTERGFYYSEGAAQTMIYLLSYGQQWYAITDSPTLSKCEWEYIEQTIGVFSLRKLEG